MISNLGFAARTSAAAPSVPEQARGAVSDQLKVALHIAGKHDTVFSCDVLDERSASLTPLQRQWLDRARAALAGDFGVAVIKAEANERGGRFEFAQILHGAQHVAFQRDQAGRGSELAVLDSQGAPLVQLTDLLAHTGQTHATTSTSAQTQPEALRRTSLVQARVEQSVAVAQSSTVLKRNAAAAAITDDEPARRGFTPVRLKVQTQQHALGLPGGVGPMEVRLAKRTRDLHGENGAPKNDAIVANQAPDGSWIRNGDIADKLDGSFIFVRLLDGTRRVGNAVNGQNAHFQLAGRAEEVMYAGRVEFTVGRVSHYDNQSGTYVPPGELCAQAGFDDARFEDEALKKT